MTGECDCSLWHLLCLGGRRGASVCLQRARDELKHGCANWFMSTCTESGRHRAKACVSIPSVTLHCLQDNFGARFAAIVVSCLQTLKADGLSKGIMAAAQVMKGSRHPTGMQSSCYIPVLSLQNT